MKRKILSINGNRSMNFLLQTVLSAKYEFIPASDVFSGMEELKKDGNIELVLIDVDYSTQENWDFIQHISSSVIYQKPVIVLASERNRRFDKKVAEEKVYESVMKPFSPLDLVRSIDKLMYAAKATIN
jgi:DNA-binding NtrC family response regulator